MYLSSSSSTGIRFLASIKQGNGLKPSARAAGINKEVGYRWLRESYLRFRGEGLSPAEATEALGFTTSRLPAWEAAAVVATGRHHRQASVEDEAKFWAAFGRGTRVDQAAEAAGMSRSTAYRWLHARFDKLRESKVTLKRCQELLRLTDRRCQGLERERLARLAKERNAAAAAQHAAVQSSNRHADAVLDSTASDAQARRAERDTAYWQLMREGKSNAEACRLLGMHRRTGTSLRRANNYQIPSLKPRPAPTGRYLDIRERVQIADLLDLGCSMREVAYELGRQPSTIKRELDRHRDADGRYLPHTADHDARLQRSRPKVHKLVADPRLRGLVQRKLNRCWSPDEISGWMKKAYPDDHDLRICPETIYRSLLLPQGQGLHKRYAAKLRTGRRIRKTRWRTRTGRGSRIRNMKMIDQRPAEVETRLEAGHWEGDLIVGVGSVSAMVTLRERKTQYGIIVNLPRDHTAASVNAAITSAFAVLPSTLKRTLTWDQGVEMASHEALTEATGVPVFFADRSSPWQRGANENFNGLVRQYFPKGTNLAVHSTRHVNHVMRELNTRPRKNLDYDTPAARFRAEHNAPARPVG
ncbi:IS30 family transposase [Paeniglutamicibacter kerguelensis]|uniref:IS30 family transposase n=1 Tax=Paeniglutamicibacter kerguelensis TaxID=254788 RepID=A0ABS4X867_9MICC|nr:IS30 family transposase [Paeniglutamicibacter kerguelensis]MBP2384660.1 IS30 family transposase [Paeniglutamicibacter kerguelensis]